MCDRFTVGRCARSCLLAVSHDEERLLLAGSARSSVTSWSRCLVVIDLISVQTLFISGQLSRECGVNINPPLNCLPKKYICIYKIYIKEIYLIVWENCHRKIDLYWIVQDKWKKVVTVYSSCRTFTERSAIFGRTQTLEHVVLVFCHDASVLAVISLNKKSNNRKFSLVKKQGFPESKSHFQFSNLNA